MAGKYRSRAQLGRIVKRLKREGYRVGLINGVFDLIHAGHIDIIERAKRVCDYLIVAINSDSSTRRLKGKGRPVLKEEERIKIISALSDVDFVTVFDEDTADKTLEIIKPDFHIKGIEYKGKTLPESKTDKKYNIKVILLGSKKLNSTTDIIKKIKSI